MTEARPVRPDPRFAPDLLAATGGEIWDRRIAAAAERVEASRTRDRIASVDALVSLLEDRNLAGERAMDRRLRQRLYRLQEEVGVPLPRKALRARNTARLHAVLLDWQETLLDRFIPQRGRFPDRHDRDWGPPTPV